MAGMLTGQLAANREQLELLERARREAAVPRQEGGQHLPDEGRAKAWGCVSAVQRQSVRPRREPV